MTENNPLDNKGTQNDKSTTGEEKAWVYLIFFLIGIISYIIFYPLGFLLEFLSGNITGLQNILCDVGWCDIDLLWMFQFLFPFLMCSILLAIGVYAFKERSFAFALKVFVISFAAISLLFFGGLSFLNLIQPPIHPFLIFLLILLILFIVGFTFKKQPLFSFALRAFSISFIALFLVITGFFMWVASAEVLQGMGIEEVNKPLNKFEYTEITEAELEEYPALKKAVEGNRLDMNYTEWERTRNFLDKKWAEKSNLFVIDEKSLEEELNKSIVTVNMRNIFASEGYPIPENSYLKGDGDRWYVIKRYYLFSIMDSEVEKELNRINITGRDTRDIVPVKLKNVFNSSGFSLPENANISIEDGGWIIHVGTGYTILKEEGKLNVYTGDEKTHEILREDGRLKVVYLGPQGSPIFKIREKYYRFSFWVS